VRGLSRGEHRVVISAPGRLALTSSIALTGSETHKVALLTRER
jgi:hypothetical protein